MARCWWAFDDDLTFGGMMISYMVRPEALRLHLRRVNRIKAMKVLAKYQSQHHK